MPASDVTSISKIDGVDECRGRLDAELAPHRGHGARAAAAQPGQFGGPGAGGGPPNNINATSLSVSGVDQTQEELGAITPGQIVKGRYFGSGDARQAILNESYASSEGLSVGDTVKLGGKNFTVIGIAETPLGGQSSDVYVKLSQLQELADRKGRVNTVYVRAESLRRRRRRLDRDREHGRRRLGDDRGGSRRARLRHARRRQEPRLQARRLRSRSSPCSRPS